MLVLVSSASWKISKPKQYLEVLGQLQLPTVTLRFVKTVEAI